MSSHIFVLSANLNLFSVRSTKFSYKCIFVKSHLKDDNLVSFISGLQVTIQNKHTYLKHLISVLTKAQRPATHSELLAKTLVRSSDSIPLRQARPITKEQITTLLREILLPRYPVLIKFGPKKVFPEKVFFAKNQRQHHKERRILGKKNAPFGRLETPFGSDLQTRISHV